MKTKWEDDDLRLAERAARWVDRMKTAGAKERAEFMRWVRQSPANVRESLIAAALDLELSRIDPERKIDINNLRAQSSLNVVTVQPPNSRGANVEPFSRPRRWMLAAGLGVAAAAAALLVVFSYPLLTKDSAAPTQYATTIGEQRAVSLEDGSVVHLNTKSNVRVAFSDSARDVYLNEGQAIFKVKHDAERPFRVHVANAVVQAIGTQFDVHLQPDRTNVAVLEGIVQIIQDTGEVINKEALAKLPENTKVPAGEAVSIAKGKLSPHINIDVSQATAWQQRRLVFRSSTLAEIVAEFNRYNRIPQIRVEGEMLQGTRYSGAFDADNPESLLRLLAADSRIALDRRGSELVIRIS